jgi:hypothetical protein
MTRATRGRVFGPIAVAVALIALAACGGSAGGEADSETGTDAGSLDEEAQALDFAECMRDNGVELPDPGPGPQGFSEAFQEIAGDYDQATLEQAIAACEDRMPQFASEEQHDDEVMLDLAECLRDEGLDVSDNPFADAHTGAVDQEEFVAAMEVCRQVLSGDGS